MSIENPNLSSQFMDVMQNDLRGSAQTEALAENKRWLTAKYEGIIPGEIDSRLGCINDQFAGYVTNVALHNSYHGIGSHGGYVKANSDTKEGIVASISVSDRLSGIEEPAYKKVVILVKDLRTGGQRQYASCIGDAITTIPQRESIDVKCDLLKARLVADCVYHESRGSGSSRLTTYDPLTDIDPILPSKLEQAFSTDYVADDSEHLGTALKDSIDSLMSIDGDVVRQINMIQTILAAARNVDLNPLLVEGMANFPELIVPDSPAKEIITLGGTLPFVYKVERVSYPKVGLLTESLGVCE